MRHWEPADAPVFLAAYGDGEIRRRHTRRPSTKERVREWFDGYGQDWQRERGGHWAVTGHDGEVRGRITPRGMDFDDGTAEAA
nr:GNAT family N-acetyltransferase [Streptomyces sp. SID9727]